MILAATLKEGIISSWMRIPGAETVDDLPRVFHENSGGQLQRRPDLDQDGASAFVYKDPSQQIYLAKNAPSQPADLRLRGDETEMPWVETPTPANHVPDEEHPIIPGADLDAHLGRS